MKYKKTLIAGPWVGEFGWELFAWQGYVRALSRNYDETIVISRSNSKALYEDFFTDFISFDEKTGQSDSFFMHNFDMKMQFKKIVESSNISLNKQTSVLLPKRIGFPPHTHFSEVMSFGEIKVKPEYVCFGEKANKKYDYIFHLRNRGLRKEDNWSIDNWLSLKQLLNSDRIACVGTKSQSGWIPGTDDLRDINLKELFSVLKNSDYVFGPSSGPMHLSSLCGAKHIVWGNQQMSLNRYEKNWNPLKTPVIFLDEYKWHQSAEYVYNSFLNWKDKNE